MSGCSKVSAPVSDRLSRGPERLSRSGKERAYCMGRRMSGRPSWALTVPSRNCTALCTMLCGCISTSICLASMPKSHLASIISKPLFIMVAESMVILAPMCHVGCRRACAALTVESCSLVSRRKGPPLAVSSSLSILSGFSPTKHWKMALCSLSTGRMGDLWRREREVMSSPATTSVSLLARAICLPARMAAMVGSRPLNPTVAVSTTSMQSICTTSHRALAPQ